MATLKRRTVGDDRVATSEFKDYVCMCDEDSEKKLNTIILGILKNYRDYVDSRRRLLTTKELCVLSNCINSIEKLQESVSLMTSIEFGEDVMKCDISHNSTIRLPLVRAGASTKTQLVAITQLTCAGEFIKFINRHQNKSIIIHEDFVSKFNTATEELSKITSF